MGYDDTAAFDERRWWVHLFRFLIQQCRVLMPRSFENSLLFTVSKWHQYDKVKAALVGRGRLPIDRRVSSMANEIQLVLGVHALNIFL